MASTNAETTMPGMTDKRGSEKMASRPIFATTPNETSGNCKPKPRNESVASARMIRANSRTPSVSSAEVKFGRMCLNMIRVVFAPINSAASTYASCLTDITTPRVMRANTIQPLNASTNINVHVLPPNTAIMIIAIKRPGNAT